MAGQERSGSPVIAAWGGVDSLEAEFLCVYLDFYRCFINLEGQCYCEDTLNDGWIIVSVY